MIVIMIENLLNVHAYACVNHILKQPKLSNS